MPPAGRADPGAQAGRGAPLSLDDVERQPYGRRLGDGARAAVTYAGAIGQRSGHPADSTLLLAAILYRAIAPESRPGSGDNATAVADGAALYRALTARAA